MVESVFRLFCPESGLDFSSIYTKGVENFQGKSHGIFWTSVEFLQAVKLILEGQPAPGLRVQAEGVSVTLSDVQVMNITSHFAIGEIRRHLETKAFVLLSCSICLGKNKCESGYQRELNFWMSLPCFAGLFAAQSKRSYYIFGFDPQVYYYLDPHAIISGKDEGSLASHVVHRFYAIGYHDLNPFMTLTFLLDKSNIDGFEKAVFSNASPRELISVTVEEELDDGRESEIRLEEFRTQLALSSVDCDLMDLRAFQDDFEDPEGLRDRDDEYPPLKAPRKASVEQIGYPETIKEMSANEEMDFTELEESEGPVNQATQIAASSNVPDDPIEEVEWAAEKELPPPCDLSKTASQQSQEKRGIFKRIFGK